MKWKTSFDVIQDPSCEASSLENEKRLDRDFISLFMLIKVAIFLEYFQFIPGLEMFRLNIFKSVLRLCLPISCLKFYPQSLWEKYSNIWNIIWRYQSVSPLPGPLILLLAILDYRNSFLSTNPSNNIYSYRIRKYTFKYRNLAYRKVPGS